MRGRKKKAQTQVQSPKNVPPKPDSLDEIASKRWDELVEILSGMNVLSAADGPMLELFVLAYSDYRHAREKIKTDAEVPTGRGSRKGSVYVGMARDARDFLRHLGAEFGLTPTSRSRLSVNPHNAAAEELADFLKA